MSTKYKLIINCEDNGDLKMYSKCSDYYCLLCDIDTEIRNEHKHGDNTKDSLLNLTKRIRDMINEIGMEN